MTAQELIKRHEITLHTEWDSKEGYFMPTGKIYFRNARTQAEKDAIGEKKAEILAILMPVWEAGKREYDERKAKINSIEGLQEIKAAQADLDAWQAKFERSFYGPNACGGLGVGPRPKYDIDAMKAAYPRAAAYLMANDWSFSDHDVKASAGKKALEKIINGDDYSAAIDEMRHEWDAYTELHAFD